MNHTIVFIHCVGILSGEVIPVATFILLSLKIPTGKPSIKKHIRQHWCILFEQGHSKHVGKNRSFLLHITTPNVYEYSIPVLKQCFTKLGI